LVTPSLNKTISITTPEALSCGVYLITTRASGFEDMIQEGANGNFFGFKDWESLYDLLRKFNKYRNIKAGKTKIYKAFEWKSIVNNYMKILEDSS